jgi:flagellar basal body-associated protein FliL
MADRVQSERSEETPAAEEPKKNPRKRKGIFMGGGILALVAAAYIGSLVAMPGSSKSQPFDGPFLADLSSGDIQVNLRGDGGRRYLVMTLKAKYEGYSQAYVAERIADPVYQAELQDALIGLARQKTMEEVSHAVGEETLLVEIQEAIEPLLFPIHVGNEIGFAKPDGASGLRPGASSRSASMRGGFRAHFLHVDQTKSTISLDDGPPVSFDGSEDDLLVEDAKGLCVFVDVTGLEEGFVGDVHVGTFGRVLSILKGRFLTQ